MKNQIENIKRNWKSESKKTAFVILGFVGGRAISKGFDWLVAKYPEIGDAVKYGKPIVIAGGGWLMSTASSTNQIELKYIGYGLQAAGAFEGIKLIPIANEYLGGLEENIGATYYMENGKPNFEIGDFGINSLPINSLDMENAPNVKLNLPDLGIISELDGTNNISGSEDGENSDLGYNADKFDGIL